MPAAFVQAGSNAADTGTAQATCAFPSNVGAGERLLVVMVYYDLGDAAADDITSVTDTLGTTFTRKGGFDDSGTSGLTYEEWYGLAPTGGGANTVTVNFTEVKSTQRLIVHEYSGNALASVSDKFGAGVFTGTTTPVSPSRTPDTDGQIIIGTMCISFGTPTIAPGSGYTERIDNGTSVLSFASEDQIQTTAAAITADFTLGASHSGIIAISTYRAAAEGGGGDVGMNDFDAYMPQAAPAPGPVLAVYG